MNPQSALVAASACGNVTAARRSGGLPRMSPTVSFYLLASITLAFLAGSSAPTPLYPIYQAAWGFSPVIVTVIFGIYALAVLAALLVAGRLSDHLGRRPVLIASTLAQVLAMLVLTTASGVAGLLAGRVLQGLATGAAMAAVGAGLIDIDRTRGAVANAIAPILGTALGGLVGGLMVHFLPAPTHLVYLALAAVFLLQCLGLLLMPESIARAPGALASLRPQIAVPAQVRTQVLLAIPVLVAAWSVGGFYASLGPGLIRNIFGFDASLIGGIALFVLAASGAAAVLLLQRREPAAMMRFGALALLAGMAVVVGALALASAPLYFVGTVITGAGFGTGFQGAIRSVVPLAAAHERAGVLSVIFVVSYLAMGLPAVGAGLLIAEGNRLATTAQEFGLAVMLLAALALLGMWLQRRPGRGRGLRQPEA